MQMSGTASCYRLLKQPRSLSSILDRGLPFVIVVAILSPATLDGYNRNVHYELTRFLAQSAGLSITAAIAIANEDQRVDDDISTGPYLNPNSRRLYHFVSPERLDELRKAVVSSCSLTDAGFYFHALEERNPAMLP
jgi:hypothetical protein